jgi:hypothetical protein
MKSGRPQIFSANAPIFVTNGENYKFGLILLHVSGGTVVEAELKGGKVTTVKVTLQERPVALPSIPLLR